MKLSALGELPLVDFIKGRFADLRKGKLIHGIGDDAAVIGPPKGKLLASSDLMAEGVHFDLSYTTPYQLGFKLVSVNVSDIYAMGGKPLQLLLALALPARTDTAYLDSFLKGVRAALDLYGASLAGGDLSGSPDTMTLAATVLGKAQNPVLRKGARPGDSLYVTGPLGDAACGLELLRKIGRPVKLGQRGVRGPLPWKVMEPLIRRHVMPEARRPGRWLSSARAMIDISDGLALDLGRLCAESGVGARVELEAVPVSLEMREAATELGLSPHDLMMSGGEDYELLFAATDNIRGRVRKIGTVVEGEGVTLRAADGTESALRPIGYRHFTIEGEGTGKGGGG